MKVTRNPTPSHIAGIRDAMSKHLITTRIDLRNSPTDRPPLFKDSRMHSRRVLIEMDRDLFAASEEQVPIDDSREEAAADEVAQEGRDHGLPDVVADGDVWGAEEDGERDEVHVGDDVVGAEPDEAHDGEPDGDDFGDDLARGDGEEDGHADEPVAWSWGKYVSFEIQGGDVVYDWMSDAFVCFEEAANWSKA